MIVAHVMGKTDLVWSDWLDEILSYFDGQSIDQASSFPIKDLAKRLDEVGLGTLLWHTTVLGNLAGRDEANNDRSDAMVIPLWLKLPFLQAIEILRRKTIIPVKSYYDMEEGYHSWAFSVARITKIDLLDRIKRSLIRAQIEGTPFEEWREKFRESYKKSYGSDPSYKRAYTIFDTNIRSAHGTGRGQQMKDISDRNPEVEYVGVWRWRDSVHPRPHHQALHNKAIPFRHDFWQKCSTPAGFGCRCSVNLMRRSLAERLGIEILPENKIPDPTAIAESGFRYPQWGTPSPTDFVKRKKQELSQEAGGLI